MRRPWLDTKWQQTRANLDRDHAAQHALQLTKELLIVRAARALLLESFAAELGRWAATRA